jgi:isocitrate/isopropylmalate dehydrogenase
MKRFSIAVIPGDGVGQEVVPAALRVLESIGPRFDVAFDFQHFEWGAEYYFRNGRMMPADALDLLRPLDAILLGAVGDPKIPDHITLNGLLLPIRRGFDQFANIRPAVLYPGVVSPLAQPGEIDMVVVRENTEGEYAQVGGFVYHHQTDEVAVQTALSSPIAASSAWCAWPSSWRASATASAALLPSPSRTRKASAWCCGTGFFNPSPPLIQALKRSRCWWTRRP